MTDLIQRIEATKEPSVDLFEDAFVVIHGPKPPRVHGGSQEWLDWLDLHNPFLRMLNAQAWTSAAEMLVPEGWRPYDADMSVKGRTRYTIEGPKTLWAVDEDGERCAGSDWYKNGVAAHPSLALLAAILRAERKDDE